MFSIAHKESECHRGCPERHRHIKPREKEKKTEQEEERHLKRIDVKTRQGRRKAVKIVKTSVRENLYDNIPISSAPNCHYSKQEIFQTIFEAVASQRYITPYCDAARARGRHLPDGDTVFYRLEPETLGGIDGVVNWANDRLHRLADLGTQFGLFDGQLIIAEDQTEEGVFGRPDRSAVGSTKVKGATSVHRLMIAQSVTKGKNRLPFELSRSGPLQTPSKVCVNVLDQVLHLHPNLWFLADREFFTTEVIGALLRYSLPWIIPAVKNDKVKVLIPTAKKLAEPVIPGRSDRVYIQSDFQLGEGDKAVHFPLVFIYRPEEIKPERQLFIFSTHTPITPEEVLSRADIYDLRWGIETGNRDQDKLQGRTRSPCPVIQWFMQVLGVLLFALWWMCNVFLSGGPPPERYPLTIDMFQDILQRCTRWSLDIL